MSTLQADSTWIVVQNGFVATMTLHLVDKAGLVTGSIRDENGTLKLQGGHWGEYSRQLIFARTLPNGEYQKYVGYLFDKDVQVSGANPPTTAFAGTFTGSEFEDPGRPAFGWFALEIPPTGVVGTDNKS